MFSRYKKNIRCHKMVSSHVMSCVCACFVLCISPWLEIPPHYWCTLNPSTQSYTKERAQECGSSTNNAQRLCRTQISKKQRRVTSYRAVTTDFLTTGSRCVWGWGIKCRFWKIFWYPCQCVRKRLCTAHTQWGRQTGTKSKGYCQCLGGHIWFRQMAMNFFNEFHLASLKRA